MEGQTFREGCDYKEKSDSKIIYWGEEKQQGQSYNSRVSRRVLIFFFSACALTSPEWRVRVAHRRPGLCLVTAQSQSLCTQTTKRKGVLQLRLQCEWAWRRVGGAGN